MKLWALNFRTMRVNNSSLKVFYKNFHYLFLNFQGAKLQSEAGFGRLNCFNKKFSNTANSKGQIKKHLKRWFNYIKNVKWLINSLFQGQHCEGPVEDV
jgi:hypothetical protein